MPYTVQDLQALEAAIATGALEVEYADKKIKYRSLAEMQQIRNQMLQELGTAPKTPKRIFAQHSKGVYRDEDV